MLLELCVMHFSITAFAVVACAGFVLSTSVIALLNAVLSPLRIFATSSSAEGSCFLDVLILEALAQTGGILIHQKGFVEKTAVLLSVNNAKFRRPALPGDVLTMHVHGAHLSSKGGKVQAKAMIDGELAAEAVIGFALRGFEQI